MVNQEGYNYDEFLSDSSDDSFQRSPYIIKQNNDDWNYREAYQKSSSVVHKGTTEHLKIALINVVEMAKEQINNLTNTDKVIGVESINMAEEYIKNLEDSNAMLAKADQIEIKTTK